jgi:diguanylate cyclase (GGDEF)-like protein
VHDGAHGGVKSGPIPADNAGVTPQPPRPTERLADVGLAPMLTALATLHAVAGGVAAAVLEAPDGVVVGASDAVAAVVLLGAAALCVRLGASARDAGAGRRTDLAVTIVALAVAGVATALRMIATGAVWSGLELPLVLVVAAALPRRRALAAAVAGLTPGGGAVAGVLLHGAGTTGELLGSLLPVAALAAAAAVALAWRRRVALLTARLAAAEEQARLVAVRDALTGAVNRQGLEMVAAPMLENARRQGEAVHCLLVDVDDFRRVNEEAGAPAGDDVLRAVTAALRSAVRNTDVVARWSGDEFAVVGPGTGTSPLELERRVHASLSEAPPLPPDVWGARVSIGSATLVPWDEGDLGGLLRRADQDMRLRRSLRRQRAERDAGPVPPPQQHPVEDGAEHS